MHLLFPSLNKFITFYPGQNHGSFIPLTERDKNG